MLMGDGADIPWRLLHIEFLMEDYETGGGKEIYFIIKRFYDNFLYLIYSILFIVLIVLSHQGMYLDHNNSVNTIIVLFKINIIIMFFASLCYLN